MEIDSCLAMGPKTGKNTFFLKYGYIGKKITFDSNFDSGNLLQVDQLSDTKVINMLWLSKLNLLVCDHYGSRLLWEANLQWETLQLVQFYRLRFPKTYKRDVYHKKYLDYSSASNTQP